MASVEAKDLVKSYRGKRVVDSISLQVESGEVVGLLGPNGAGKTTTFYMMVGLVKPDGGQVFLNDEEITSCPMHVRARKGIGYLPQEASIFRKLTVRDNILAILETRPLSRAERETRLGELLEELGIGHLASRKAHTLSGGERRRVEITRALVTTPSFILLDEPFAGIDPIAVIDIQKVIAHLKARGIGVVLSDHNVRETLEVCDRAYIVNEGVLIESGPPEVIASSSVAREVYLGEAFRL